MGSVPPKKRRTKRARGARRSHLVRELAERVNATSPVKVRLGVKGKKQLARSKK